MRASDYRYRLVTSKTRGLIPISEVNEGEEIFCFGEWKYSPKPVQAPCLECSFDLLPTTIFDRKIVLRKKEVSICHDIFLKPTTDFKPELSVRGFFKENRTSTNLIFNDWADLPYWLPRLIKIYNQPFFPVSSNIGWSIYNVNKKKFTELKDEELTERNLEYVLEGMLRQSFSYFMGKYNVLSHNLWNETHRLVMRLLDIECDILSSRTVVKNPVNMYRHIKDDYIKSKVKDEEIVYNLRRSNRLPLYTNGYKIKEKKEVTDWILPGLNPDINGINPINCWEKGFTSLQYISSTEYFTRTVKGTTDKKEEVKSTTPYLQDNLYKFCSE